MSKDQKVFLRIFVIGVISSFTTLAVSGNYFLSTDIPTDMLPDWNRIPELVISCIISGVISTANYLVIYLERENEDDDPTMPHPDQPVVEPTPTQLPEGK